MIGMKACGSAHHWARKLGEFGHTIKLMTAQFVKPYVKTNKNDMADAESIPGIGPIAASAIVATVGSATEFKNGRQLAAWMGLVPRQYASGGKQNCWASVSAVMLNLRTLLIHGARAVMK